MTKEIRGPNVEKSSGVRSPASSFGFRHSFGFRRSSFGFSRSAASGQLNFEQQDKQKMDAENNDHRADRRQPSACAEPPHHGKREKQRARRKTDPGHDGDIDHQGSQQHQSIGRKRRRTRIRKRRSRRKDALLGFGLRFSVFGIWTGSLLSPAATRFVPFP